MIVLMEDVALTNAGVETADLLFVSHKREFDLTLVHRKTTLIMTWRIERRLCVELPFP